MNREYDVIVVGGGMAGLTSAAFLAKNGYKTLLFERNKKTGGLVNSFNHQGYTFDGGIRAFENSGILLPMLNSLGISLDYVKNSITIGIHNNLAPIEYKDSLTGYLDMLKNIFSENIDDITKIGIEIKKVMEYMDVIYGIDNPLFKEKMDSQYLKNTLLPWFIKYLKTIKKINKLNEPVEDYLKRFTNNQELIDMIIQHFFKKTPTFFALSYFSLYMDYIYPKEGTGILVKKITDYIISKGGEIKLETSVNTINVNNKEILIGEEVYKYKKLVWAADQKSLYDAVGNIKGKRIMKKKTEVKKSFGAESILTIFAGIDLNHEYFIKKSGAHSFYTPKIDGLSSIKNWDMYKDSREKLEEWVIEYLDKTTYEISIPKLRNLYLAPVSKSGLIISTLLDYHLVDYIFKQGWYNEFKDLCSKKIIQVLNSSIYPDISKKLEFSFCATPITLENETANAHGSIVGWSFSNETIPAICNFKKIAKSINTPFKDIYQCGQWTFAPGGLPVSILTGKFVVNKIMKKIKIC